MIAIIEANNLIAKYGTTDPFELCESLGINLIFHDLGQIRGYYVKNRRSKFIVLSNALEHYQRRIVCAHELGHAILHPDLSTPFYTEHTWLSKDRFENEANQFAAALILASFSSDELDGLGLEQISIFTGLPVEYIKK